MWPRTANSHFAHIRQNNINSTGKKKNSLNLKKVNN